MNNPTDFILRRCDVCIDFLAIHFTRSTVKAQRPFSPDSYTWLRRLMEISLNVVIHHKMRDAPRESTSSMSQWRYINIQSDTRPKEICTSVPDFLVDSFIPSLTQVWVRKCFGSVYRNLPAANSPGRLRMTPTCLKNNIRTDQSPDIDKRKQASLVSI